ncbi:BtrH N-terminal domain-containing protein [Leptospira sp. 2 VSF19]|uniref:BtrH N-terminal domain-containing protein n=1 Tax=Leptospira soteropolitanensis TaxID=2950025 RepID=A0AAW5VJX6_9LEPT|nr:BtrH N-terminal domain-containing protein [Leptospira soteropolitanensis]MCW7492649.1 BtrH N-terminal domain-containing protein [Leptospira soteropolitanensis]MCW7500332.1 BtrH N-terminal domain-containing protein [Leptospira soteropolitanensis]MCW7522633.1 BtrH N-terminal domain-containing protein [Leptospira soteropolitanensis]MCW7526489.1 BtrH N-terminal domain-containing protein [Leptospira soteropolitanensis]MCW7530302.1 BtrH N-terminal domain-containing protein [Leptospira soteropolit
MILTNLSPFEGVHCETTTTGTLLKHIGIDLSEPMLFGIGEGLSFIFWNMKSMDFPFIGGRTKPDQITTNITKNLSLNLNIQETASKSKAWMSVRDLIDSGIPVGLKLDCFHLEYFSKPIHFAGHYAALYGYDKTNAYLVDTKQQGTKVKTSLKSLELARNEKGPMASKNLFYTIAAGKKQTNLGKVVVLAAKNNAREYLNPPITNVSYKGIGKLASHLEKWFHSSKDIQRDFGTTAMMMEKAGTGGAIFRNLYRDFLLESYELTNDPIFKRTHLQFQKIAAHWTEIATLFDTLGKKGEVRLLGEIKDLLHLVSELEFSSMNELSKLKGK